MGWEGGIEIGRIGRCRVGSVLFYGTLTDYHAVPWLILDAQYVVDVLVDVEDGS